MNAPNENGPRLQPRPVDALITEENSHNSEAIMPRRNPISKEDEI